MNSKKYKATIAMVIVLMLLAGGLFVYNNFFALENGNSNKVGIYVAKEDIKANAILTKDMFVYVGISRDSVLPSLVTDFSKVEGKKLIGTLLKHEPLAIVRVAESSTTKPLDFTLKVVPDTKGDIQKNDMIRVYAQYTDRKKATSVLKVLLDTKQVTTTIKLSDGEEQIYVEATEQEIKDYYIAEAIGQIIVVEYNLMDLVDFTSEEGSGVIFEPKTPTVSPEDKFDANSESVAIAQNTQEANNEGISAMTYNVLVGDDIEKISVKFKTDVATITNLNNGRTVFVVGETITVPSN